MECEEEKANLIEGERRYGEYKEKERKYKEKEQIEKESNKQKERIKQKKLRKREKKAQAGEEKSPTLAKRTERVVWRGHIHLICVVSEQFSTHRSNCHVFIFLLKTTKHI